MFDYAKKLLKFLPFVKSRWYLWVIAIVLAVVVGFGAQWVLKSKDSPVEQAAEKVFEELTGFDVDFSK